APVRPANGPASTAAAPPTTPRRHSTAAPRAAGPDTVGRCPRSAGRPGAGPDGPGGRLPASDSHAEPGTPCTAADGPCTPGHPTPWMRPPSARRVRVVAAASPRPPGTRRGWGPATG